MITPEMLERKGYRFHGARDWDEVEYRDEQGRTLTVLGDFQVVIDEDSGRRIEREEEL